MYCFAALFIFKLVAPPAHSVDHNIKESSTGGEKKINAFLR